MTQLIYKKPMPPSAVVLQHRTLENVDIGIIVVYFLVIFGIGYYFARRERTSEDYFLAGRDGAKKDHVLQYNLYRFLVERGYPVGESYGTYKSVEITEIQAYYMTMMKIVVTGTNMTDITDYCKTDPEQHQHEVNREAEVWGYSKCRTTR